MLLVIDGIVIFEVFEFKLIVEKYSGYTVTSDYIRKKYQTTDAIFCDLHFHACMKFFCSSLRCPSRVTTYAVHHIVIIS